MEKDQIELPDEDGKCKYVYFKHSGIAFKINENGEVTGFRAHPKDKSLTAWNTVKQPFKPLLLDGLDKVFLTEEEYTKKVISNE